MSGLSKSGHGWTTDNGHFFVHLRHSPSRRHDFANAAIAASRVGS
jgi:hypothetical protein